MKIIVCIKQVPDSQRIKIDPVRGTLIREGVPSIINPNDKNAIEEAIRLKERTRASHLIVLSMGPPQAASALREALAMGADEAILLTDPAFAGSDTKATASILASAIHKIGAFDIIICGRQAIDGDTAQVGPQLAEYLQIPQITYVSKVEITERTIIAHRNYEDGYFVMNSHLPILLTAIKELNQVRIPSIRNIRQAFELPISIWGLNDLVIDKDIVGLEGSPTKVLKSFVPQHNSQVEFLTGAPNEIAHSLIDHLHAEHVIRL